MNILVAIAFGIAGALLGSFVGFIGAMGFAAATNMSNMEGARGYFAVAVAFLGGLIGLIGSIVITLMRRGSSGITIVTGTLTAVAGIGALAVIVVGAWYLAQPHYLGVNGPTPALVFQIAAPANQMIGGYDELQVELQTDKNGSDGLWRREVLADDQSRPVREGLVQLYFRTSQRMLVLKLPNGETQIFRLKLPADPTSEKFRRWSEWHPADFIDHPGQQTQPTRATPERAYTVRYQIETYLD